MNASFARVLLGLAIFGLAASVNAAPPPADGKRTMSKAPAEMTRSGVVLNHIDANEYTYLEISEKDRKVWLAAPLTRLDDGEQVRFPDGVVMTHFFSKMLQRTFDSIIFVDGIEVAKAR